MCIIKFSTQQRNEIYYMTNDLKIIISIRGGELTIFGVFINLPWAITLYLCLDRGFFAAWLLN